MTLSDITVDQFLLFVAIVLLVVALSGVGKLWVWLVAAMLLIGFVLLGAM